MLHSQHLKESLADGNLLASLSAELQQHQQQQEQQFRDGANIRILVSERAQFLDQLLALAWHQIGFP
ncbi:MAG: hypothetical protein OIF34_10435, partial [Porticoccaceae bacterium]|nr:hypothetical protein [Porticoccaceae bacterium]